MTCLRDIRDCTRKRNVWGKTWYLPTKNLFFNDVIEWNLSNDWSVKVRKFHGATVDDLRHLVLPIIQRQPKYLIIYAGTNDPVKFASRDSLNKLLQLKSFIQEKLSDAEITVCTPTLRSDKGNAVLTVRQLTNHLISSCYRTVPSAILEIFSKFLIFSNLSYILQITSKYEKRRKYLPILYEATCDNYFIVKCLFK